SGNSGTASASGAGTNNAGGTGGGIYITNTPADIDVSTIDGNSPGGPGPSDVIGGGIFHDGGTLNLTSHRLPSNGNATVGGGGNNIWNAGGTVNFENSILAEPHASTGFVNSCGGGDPNSLGHNMTDDTGAGGNCFGGGTATGDLPDDPNV